MLGCCVWIVRSALRFVILDPIRKIDWPQRSKRAISYLSLVWPLKIGDCRSSCRSWKSRYNFGATKLVTAKLDASANSSQTHHLNRPRWAICRPGETQANSSSARTDSNRRPSMCVAKRLRIFLNLPQLGECVLLGGSVRWPVDFDLIPREWPPCSSISHRSNCRDHSSCVFKYSDCWGSI